MGYVCCSFVYNYTITLANVLHKGSNNVSSRYIYYVKEDIPRHIKKLLYHSLIEGCIYRDLITNVKLHSEIKVVIKVATLGWNRM